MARHPPPDSPLQGRIENNVYTSPAQTFRLRLPELSSNAKFREEIPTLGTMLFAITDDLCREFIVSERPGFLGEQSLDSWVDSQIVQELKGLGLKVQAKPVKTRHGGAIALRYRAPAAAPCTGVAESAGKVVETKRDADVGWYVFHQAGKFYRLIYLIGTGPGVPDSWFIQREPVDEILARFAEDFEIIGMKEK